MSDSDKKTNERKFEAPPTPPPMGGPGPGRPPMHGMMQGRAKLDHPRGVLWRWIFSFLKNFKGRYIFYMTLLLSATLLFSITPLISSRIIDEGIVANNPIIFRNLVIVYVSVMGINAFINWFANYSMTKIGQVVVFDIRNELFTQLQDMSMTYFDKRSSGDIISVMTNDVDQLNQLVAGQLVQLISSFVSIILTIILMFVLNPILAALSLITVPIFLIMIKMFQRKVTGIFKETRKTISKVTSSIQDNVAGAKIIQAYGQQKRASSEFDEANKANYNANIKARTVFATFFPFTQLISTVITVVVLFVGGYLAIGNVSIAGSVVSVGVLTAFIAYLAEFFRPFMMIMQIQSVTESALAASDRIYKLLEERVEIKDPTNPKSFPAEPKGKIELDNVTFGYIIDAETKKIPKEPEKKSIMQKMMEKRSHPAKSQEMDANTIGSMHPMDPKMVKNMPPEMVAMMQERLKTMDPAMREKMRAHLQATNPEMLKAIQEKISENPVSAPNGSLPIANVPVSLDNGKPPAPNGGNGMSPMATMGPMGAMPMTPEMILNMVKGLEKMLNQNSIKSAGMGGGMGGEGGMGGGMGGAMGNGIAARQGMLRMLAIVPIAPDLFEQFPKIVQDAIKETKQLMDRERSKGYVIEDMSLTIPPGSTLAIVGETGAGKTTLIKLLTRFYDILSGVIKIDGVDIREVKKTDLRRLMGLVPQDSFMFTGSIQENLLYGIKDITPDIEEKMLSVSKFLGLHNFIDALPEKYETKLTENAQNISIGQRQLIAFARALLTDPIILMLDEATSSVDPYTETLIQDALDKARKGRTTIIIAHRLSTIRNADHIIVIGKETHGIVEQGTHDALMSLNGKYKRLLEMQRREIESHE